MSKWRTASAISGLKAAVEYTHLRRETPTGDRELFGTIAILPFISKSGESVYAVGLSTRRTQRMPSKKIGRDTALGRALRSVAEELGLVAPSPMVDETGAYSIVRGVLTQAQRDLFLELCEQAPERAVVTFNTAMNASSLLEAA